MDKDRHIKLDTEDLLAAKTTKDDIKKLFRMYRKVFIILLLFLVALVLFAILNVNGRGYRAIVLLVVWAVIVADLLRRIIVPQRVTIKRYRDSIEKYGKEDIARDMTSGSQEVYYLFEDRVETYVVLTESFLVMVNGIVFSWADIAGIDFVHRHNNMQKTSSINLDDKDIEMINELRDMIIKRPDGSAYKTLIALRDDEFNDLFVNICSRFPDKSFSSK